MMVTLTGRKELKKFLEDFDKDTPKKGEIVEPVSTEWLVDKPDYAERLFKIKQFERKIDVLVPQKAKSKALMDNARMFTNQEAYDRHEEDCTRFDEEIAQAHSQISKLLADE